MANKIQKFKKNMFGKNKILIILNIINLFYGVVKKFICCFVTRNILFVYLKRRYWMCRFICVPKMTFWGPD